MEKILNKLKEHKKPVIIISSIILAVVLLACIWVLLVQLNEYSLDLPDNGKFTLEYGKEDSLGELTGTFKGTIFHKEGISVPLKVKGNWDAKTLGTYNITFAGSYEGTEIEAKGSIQVVDTLPPEITLTSNPNHYTSPVGKYEEEGYSAIDLHDGDISHKVIREEKDGKIFYTATDAQGNSATVERVIVYKDVIAPVITLKGGSQYKAPIGKPYTDPGFTATDDCDGDISKNVIMEGSVNVNTAGSYVLTYKVTDSAGNSFSIQRTVLVGDFEKPQIYLGGSPSMYIKAGTVFTEPGYSATDNIDGDLTAKVQVTGGVDTSKTGNYTITYTVTDAAGNTASVNRTVFVFQKQTVADVQNPGDKVIYLTFDDGPSAHTAKLLNILDKYGVKATFFVTNQFPAYQHMIGETYRRGHTIALHTATHRYNQLYASEEAYFNDLNQIKSIVQTQTGGFSPTIVRFPGGTNNTISRRYCPGIMTKLSQTLSYHGYLYCDWNVSSGDAGGTKSTQGVVNNVINGVKNKNISVVLQHDISSYSVNAVDQIIMWGLQNGYTFLPLTESSPMTRYNPQN